MKTALKGLSKNANHRMNNLFGSNPDVKYPDAFYFRITKDWTMYYTSSKEDSVVLGVMVPEKMKMKFITMACFEISDSTSETWGLCGFEDVCPISWKLVLGEKTGTRFDKCDGQFHNMLAKKLYI